MRKDRKRPDAARPPAGDADASLGKDLEPGAIPVMEETLSVAKRDIATGAVRVTTRTETHDDIAEATLERTSVDVTRVPIGRTVAEAPPVRTEGDVTIVPVLEERLVLTTQLVLVEELHIRQRTTHETVREPVSLRRQRVTIERVEGDETTAQALPAALDQAR